MYRICSGEGLGTFDHRLRLPEGANVAMLMLGASLPTMKKLSARFGAEAGLQGG